MIQDAQTRKNMKYEDVFLVMKMMMIDDKDDICNWSNYSIKGPSQISTNPPRSSHRELVPPLTLSLVY